MKGKLMRIIRCFILTAVCLCYSANGVDGSSEVSNGKTIVDPLSTEQSQTQEDAQAKQVAQSVTPRFKRPPLHMAELLSYLTVRLVGITTNGLVSYGTGFFYDFPHPTNQSLHLPAIVSNWHVVKDVLVTSLTFTLADTNSFPSSEVYTIHIDHRVFPWIKHPDSNVDISVLPIAPALNYMREQGKTPFFFALDSSYIPDSDYLKSVTQTDEVIMIGYPGKLWDNVNNQPIFRKGILATSPSKNFCGNREFLIDMPVYKGSSGSPVLLFSEGAYFDRGKGEGLDAIMLGRRLKLLGINYATIINTVTGKVVPVPVPTVLENEEWTTNPTNEPTTNTEQRTEWKANVEIPNNIGIIMQASRLNEIEEMFGAILRSVSTGGNELQ